MESNSNSNLRLLTERWHLMNVAVCCTKAYLVRARENFSDLYRFAYSLSKMNAMDRNRNRNALEYCMLELEIYTVRVPGTRYGTALAVYFSP